MKFICEVCKKSFEKKMSEKEIVEEVRTLFGDEVLLNGYIAVCNDCLNLIKLIKEKNINIDGGFIIPDN